MQKGTLIMLAGVLVGFLPFLGFPNSWDAVLFVALGISVVALGISVRRGTRPRMKIPPASSTESHHEV